MRSTLGSIALFLLIAVLPAGAEDGRQTLTSGLPLLVGYDQREAAAGSDEPLEVIGRTPGRLEIERDRTVVAVVEGTGGFGDTELTRLADDLGALDNDLMLVVPKRAPITDEGLEAVTRLPRLTGLWLIDTGIGDAGLERLAACRGLRELDLRGTKVTDAGLGRLSDLPRLAAISLSGETIGDPGMRALVAHSTLRALYLERTSVTDAGLAGLAGLPELTSLVLAGAPITDEGAEQIGRAKRLRYLVLSGTRITDTGVSHLTDLRELRTLWLSRTEVSDASIGVLSQLAGLEELVLAATRVTPEGFEALRAALPRCKVRAEV